MFLEVTEKVADLKSQQMSGFIRINNNFSNQNIQKNPYTVKANQNKKRVPL